MKWSIVHDGDTAATFYATPEQAKARAACWHGAELVLVSNEPAPLEGIEPLAAGHQERELPTYRYMDMVRRGDSAGALQWIIG